MLMVLVLIKSYAGNLMSLLAVRYISLHIQTLEDIVNNPVVVYMNKGSMEEQAFKAAADGVMRDVWNLHSDNRIKLIENRDIVHAQTMVRKGGSAYINNELYQKVRIAQDFSATGQCDFYLGRAQFLTSMNSMAGPKGSSLVPALSRKYKAYILLCSK
ncbi:hypothetical protein Pcinc_019624 [Petrolisthes cinctipes]|uniref:Uncharacterized protein n=1 Tax=Petrolisthes cinctipes TaxID=88211 RepID=A0AAE1FJT8_PETCI|nr:hypothetical protein Pcinc_019624 [Petrolisthes cinctipes]